MFRYHFKSADESAQTTINSSFTQQQSRYIREYGRRYIQEIRAFYSTIDGNASQMFSYAALVMFFRRKT